MSKKNRVLIVVFLLILCVIAVQQQGKMQKMPGQGQNEPSSGGKSQTELKLKVQPKSRYINPEGNTVKDRIKVPKGFQRIETPEGSFERFLQNLPLKPHGTKVHYYNGGVKGRDVYVAVIDMDIGDRDLQQCADAVIRLRAEYLYSQKEYDTIHFNFTNGFRADYSRWMQGYRISVKGNSAEWVKKASYSNKYEDFRQYLNMVFAYAGTLSLSKELNPARVENIKIGDVFIHGGTPGHCAIVVDMAENKTTGEKLFMLAQGYMPAQDIHILKNPGDEALSPWYPLDFGQTLMTPEWTFSRDELMSF